MSGFHLCQINSSIIKSNNGFIEKQTEAYNQVSGTGMIQTHLSLTSKTNASFKNRPHGTYLL